MGRFFLKPTGPGDRSQDVVVVQDVLGLLGYELSGDAPGVFGVATQAALTAFQIDGGLSPTGEVDEETLEVIHEVLDSLDDDDDGGGGGARFELG